MSKLWDNVKQKYVKIKTKKNKISTNANTPAFTINQVKTNRGLSTKTVLEKLESQGFKTDSKTVNLLIKYGFLKTRLNKVKTCSLWSFIKNESIGKDLTEKTLKNLNKGV